MLSVSSKVSSTCWVSDRARSCHASFGVEQIGLSGFPFCARPLSAGGMAMHKERYKSQHKQPQRRGAGIAAEADP